MTKKRDINELAKHIADIATGEKANVHVEKNPAAVALGKLGGAKGGKARAENLSPAQRSEIARNAAKSRWENKND